MDRLIVPFPSPSRATAVSDSEADKTVGRLVKYVPIEIISGYVALSGVVSGAAQNSTLRLPGAWGLFLIGMIATPLYLWRVGRPTGVQWLQLPISTISFVLWAYALGGPFEMSGNLFGLPYETWFAALLAGAYSWLIALLWKPVAPAPDPKDQP